MSVRPHPSGPDRHGRPRCIVDWYPAGSSRRERRVFHGTVAEARRWERERVVRRDASAWGVVSSRTFGDLAGEFLAEKRAAGRSERYLADYRHLLVVELAAWGPRAAERITPADVAAFLERRRVAGCAAVTRRRERRYVRGLFLWAAARGLLAADPVRPVPAPTVAAAPPRYLAPAEYAALWAAAPGYLRDLMDVQAVCGLRIGEVCALDRADARGGLLYVRGRKARDWLALPLPPAAAEVLAGQPEHADGQAFARPPIHRGQRRRSDRWTRESALRAMKAAARRAAAVSGEPFPVKVGNHLLRHTCASWLVAAGVPIYTVRAVLGHRSVATTEIYAHLALSGLAAEFGALPERTGRALAQMIELLHPAQRREASRKSSDHKMTTARFPKARGTSHRREKPHPAAGRNPSKIKPIGNESA